MPKRTILDPTRELASTKRARDEAPVRSAPPSAALAMIASSRGAPRPADVLTAQHAIGNRATRQHLSRDHDEADRRVSAASGSGRPIPAPVREEMEASFGADFSAVRIHEGQEAAEIDAIAFTRSDDIHFAPGAYNPSSPSGRALLGHELTHVLQQRAGRVSASRGGRINRDSGLEAEADTLGARAAQGKRVNVGAAASARGPTGGGVVQCKKPGPDNNNNNHVSNDDNDNANDESAPEASLTEQGSITHLTPWQLLDLVEQAEKLGHSSSTGARLFEAIGFIAHNAAKDVGMHGALNAWAYDALIELLHDQASSSPTGYGARLDDAGIRVVLELLNALNRADPPKGCQPIKIGDFIPARANYSTWGRLANGAIAQTTIPVSNGPEVEELSGVYFLDHDNNLHDLLLIQKTIEHAGLFDPLTKKPWSDADLLRLMQYAQIRRIVLLQVMVHEANLALEQKTRPRDEVISLVTQIGETMISKGKQENVWETMMIRARELLDQLKALVEGTEDQWIFSYKWKELTTDTITSAKFWKELRNGGSLVTLEELFDCSASNNDCMSTVGSSFKSIADKLRKRPLPGQKPNDIFDKMKWALQNSGPRTPVLRRDPGSTAKKD